MKTLLTFALATLMFASCNQPKEQNAETESSNDAVTELMMSRRSIRNYKDSLINKETLDEILKCGVNVSRILQEALMNTLKLERRM